MKIITNTAISLDGRISTVQNDHVMLGSAEDLARLSVLRDEADAVLVGGKYFSKLASSVPSAVALFQGSPIACPQMECGGFTPSRF